VLLLHPALRSLLQLQALPHPSHLPGCHDWHRQHLQVPLLLLPRQQEGWACGHACAPLSLPQAVAAGSHCLLQLLLLGLSPPLHSAAAACSCAPSSHHLLLLLLLLLLVLLHHRCPQQPPQL
jgi:hypothetical protein